MSVDEASALTPLLKLRAERSARSTRSAGSGTYQPRHLRADENPTPSKPDSAPNSASATSQPARPLFDRMRGAKSPERA